MADPKDIIVQLGTAQDAVVQDVAGIMQAVGEIVQVEAQHMITEGSVSGKFHVPSKPGEPPNQDSGDLARGIIVTQPEPLRVVIAATAPYSAYLEDGSSKIAPRPFMGPAVFVTEDEVKRTLASAVSASLRKHFGSN